MNLLWINAYAGYLNFGKFSMDFLNNDIVLVGQLTGTVDLTLTRKDKIVVRPAKTPNIKQSVPISLWSVEHNHRLQNL